MGPMNFLSGITFSLALLLGLSSCGKKSPSNAAPTVTAAPKQNNLQDPQEKALIQQLSEAGFNTIKYTSYIGRTYSAAEPKNKISSPGPILIYGEAARKKNSHTNDLKYFEIRTVEGKDISSPRTRLARVLDIKAKIPDDIWALLLPLQVEGNLKRVINLGCSKEQVESAQFQYLKQFPVENVKWSLRTELPVSMPQQIYAHIVLLCGDFPGSNSDVSVTAQNLILSNFNYKHLDGPGSVAIVADTIRIENPSSLLVEGISRQSNPTHSALILIAAKNIYKLLETPAVKISSHGGDLK